MKRILLCILIFVLITAFTYTDEKTPSWPCFHGPNRTNISEETGLLKTWPENGPELAWTASNLGRGYSTVSVGSGRIFTAGMIEKNTYVIALDMKGKELWRKLNGESWQAGGRSRRWAGSYAGSRATPTIDGDTIYHLSDRGDLTSFEAAAGKEKWKLNIRTAFDAPGSKYGYSESVFILGEKLFCQAGGAKGSFVALDKNTGRILWANTDFKDPIGYSSPVRAKIGDVDQLISVTAARIYSFEPDTGKILWQYKFANKRHNNCTDVIVHKGMVFAATGYGRGSILLKPEKQENGTFKVTKLWDTNLMDNHHGGVVFLDGYLYGAGSDGQGKGWTCLKFETGEKKWQSPGKGSIMYADGMLYCYDEKGTMSLVKAAPEKWDCVSSFTVPKGGPGKYWAHPVICSGILYVRHANNLYAYNVKAK